MKILTRIKPLMAILSLLSMASAFLAFKTCNEPVLLAFEGTSMESLFQRFSTGNEIVFNLSVGFIVSVIFYLLVVWFPDRRKKIIIKKNLEDQYQSFKEETISILLFTCQNSYPSDLPKNLIVLCEFRKFFKEKVSDSQDRWGVVLDNLTPRVLADLLIEFEILLNEVSFVLSNVNIDDPDVFMFFKRLSQAVYRLKNTTPEYDDIKPLARFLWDIFAGWSFISGYREEDIVEIMISKI